MSEHQMPRDEADALIIHELEELMAMGLVEIVGINSKGDWLYAATEEGKKVVQNWAD